MLERIGKVIQNDIISNQKILSTLDRYSIILDLIELLDSDKAKYSQFLEFASHFEYENNNVIQSLIIDKIRWLITRMPESSILRELRLKLSNRKVVEIINQIGLNITSLDLPTSDDLFLIAAGFDGHPLVLEKAKEMYTKFIKNNKSVNLATQSILFKIVIKHITKMISNDKNEEQYYNEIEQIYNNNLSMSSMFALRALAASSNPIIISKVLYIFIDDNFPTDDAEIVAWELGKNVNAIEQSKKFFLENIEIFRKNYVSNPEVFYFIVRFQPTTEASWFIRKFSDDETTVMELIGVIEDNNIWLKKNSKDIEDWKLGYKNREKSRNWIMELAVRIFAYIL